MVRQAGKSAIELLLHFIITMQKNSKIAIAFSRGTIIPSAPIKKETVNKGRGNQERKEGRMK